MYRQTHERAQGQTPESCEHTCAHTLAARTVPFSAQGIPVEMVTLRLGQGMCKMCQEQLTVAEKELVPKC